MKTFINTNSSLLTWIQQAQLDTLQEHQRQFYLSLNWQNLNRRLKNCRLLLDSWAGCSSLRFWLSLSVTTNYTKHHLIMIDKSFRNGSCCSALREIIWKMDLKVNSWIKIISPGGMSPSYSIRQPSKLNNSITFIAAAFQTLGSSSQRVAWLTVKQHTRLLTW